MGAAQGILRRLADFHREMDRGLAVMRGEKPVAGHETGIDWSRRRGREFVQGRWCVGCAPHGEEPNE